MKIQIQSKSGDNNGVMDVEQTTLMEALKHLRSQGGYLTDHCDREIAVPFEEIEYIEED